MMAGGAGGQRAPAHAGLLIAPRPQPKTKARLSIEIRPFRNGWQVYWECRYAAGVPQSGTGNQLCKRPCALSLWRESHSELKL